MARNVLRRFNVRVVGSGDRVLVLGHGIGTDQSVWRRILPALVHDHRVVLYDLACSGSVDPNSFDPDRYPTIMPYVDDLIEILDTLRIAHCTFVGHSMSAMIGILASVRRPRLFTKLILIGATARFLNDWERNYHGGFERRDVYRILAAMQENYVAWASGYAPMAIGADLPEAVREFSRTLFNMRPDITSFVCQTVVLDTDLRGSLESVTAPCTILQTAGDMAVPMSAAMFLRDHLGGPTTIRVLNVQGHLPHLSSPHLVAQEIRLALP